MAALLTEVYVSIDGLEYTKLDLSKDESILMNYTTKDLQDVSKIFSPYSQTFTFPATPKNRAAFGFFGDTDVIKLNTENKFPCKIYTDGVLNLNGFIKLSDINYVNNKPVSLSGSFATSMTNLKDRIGEDLINDLPDFFNVTTDIAWTPSRVFDLLRGTSSVFSDVMPVPVSYFVPLISLNRVWGYDPTDNSPLLDNVAYEVSNSATSNKTIKSSELRPCVSFKSIIEMIKLKYNLQVVSPLDDRKEYTDLYVWCNAETVSSLKYVKLPILNNLGSGKLKDSKNWDFQTPKYAITSSTTDSSFTIVRQSSFSNNWKKYVTLKLTFENILLTAGGSGASVNINLVRKSDDTIFVSNKFDITGTSLQCSLQIDDFLFQSNTLEFYIFVQFNQPTSWSNCKFYFEYKYYDGKFGAFNSKRFVTVYFESNINNNSVLIDGTKLNLFKSLPETKVIDFLTSYFKLFNISVFDTSPDNENLFWLTPNDIDTVGKEYSKATLDYTPYVDISSHTKSTSSDYNYYNFKHKQSKYKSNVDYLAGAGLEYGQAVHPLVKPENPNEFKVETIFSIIPPVMLSGTDEVVTYYGFNSSTPEFLETGESRYTPNYGELTIFYNHGNTSLGTEELSYQSNTGTTLINSKLSSYMKVMPFCKSNNQSLGFSVLVWQSIQYLINLYSEYYQRQTERLLDPNILSQEYTLNLPTNEMYLNEATTVQGGGLTPTGFRLQNEVIIGETKFSILDAKIDVTTGKSKMTLLNY